MLVHALFNEGWSVHSIAEDCKTPLSPFIDVASLDLVRRLFRYAGATDEELAEFNKDVESWSHGSCWIGNLTDDGRRLLRIRVP